ncbi:hypothetical protein PHIM1EF22_1300 [Enterococcus phage phiM1EF22]|nr:hypothetical protein PHIM1EF22_1300 [Enterococcus phage phiM1EF22]
MLVSKDEFIKQMENKSKLVGKRLKLAIHSNKTHCMGTVVGQSENYIIFQPDNTLMTMKFYYGAYHILERL